MTLLIVDDEIEIRQLLRKFLEEEGFTVIEAVNGLDALDKMSDEIGLVLLDIMMPECDGIKACAVIRQKYMVPIMFLTAFSDEERKLQCYTQGADDYIVKPFLQKELILRVNALLRRCYEYNHKRNATVQEIQIHDLHIDLHKKKVHLKEEEIVLTYLEYEILILLASHRGSIYAIPQIYEEIWKEPYYSESANTVMVHIRNLRKKLNHTEYHYIQNVWGKGYLIES